MVMIPVPSNQPGSLARTTVWMLLGQVGRLAIQVVYFIIIARCLGAVGYGSFIGAVSLVAIVSPFATLGFGNILIKNVAVARSSFGHYWGKTLLMTAVSGSVLLVAVLLLARSVLPHNIPSRLVLIIAISDLVAARIIDVSAQAFQAVDRARWVAYLNILFSGTRLFAAWIFTLLPGHRSAVDWGYIYCLSSLLPAVFSLSIVFRELGPPEFVRRIPFRDIREGFYFAMGLSSQTVYNDIDKAMLARYSTLGATGLYAAAYRIVDVACVPTRSLLYAAYPGCFRAGKDGIDGAISYMSRLLPKGLFYSIFISFALYLVAPLVPLALGRQYGHSVEALRWLAVLPLIRTLHSFYSDALTGAGYQALRMSLQAFVAAFNVVINIWLLPRYSWHGAVASSLASDALLALCVLSACAVLRRQAALKSVLAVMS